MKKLLAEPRSLAITRNEARVEISLQDDGRLWLIFTTPKGKQTLDVKSNFDFSRNDPIGITTDFFERAEAGDKLCDGCRFRSHVTNAIENYTENVQSPEGKNPRGPRYL